MALCLCFNSFATFICNPFQRVLVLDKTPSRFAPFCVPLKVGGMALQIQGTLIANSPTRPYMIHPSTFILYIFFFHK